MVKVLLLLWSRWRLPLIETAGAALVVAGFGVMWGSGAGLLGAGGMLLVKAFEWDLDRRGGGSP